MTRPKLRKFTIVRLAARVLAPDRLRLPTLSQADAMVWWDVTDRTLRNWATKGLPTIEGPHGKPRYPLPSANTWAMVYGVMCKMDRNGKGPSSLTVEQADAFHLKSQARDWPEDFVLVPLAHDHPMREAMLRRAAEGLESAV